MQTFKRYLLRVLFILLLGVSGRVFCSEIDISMTVLKRSLDAYEALLKEQEKPALDVTSLESRHANRNVAAMVVIMQALKLGGLSPRLAPVLAPNYGRELQLVKSGAAVIMHQDAWEEDFDETVQKSLALIPHGKFVKGLYVRESALDKIRIERIEDFQNLTAVSSPRWAADWQALSQLKLKRLYPVTDKLQMINVVLLRGVDFTAQEFSQTDDMAYSTEHGRVFPLPGVKLALNGSRHIMVSRAHPDGARVFDALQKGLKIMHANGSIARYLTEARFYRAETENWKTLTAN